MFWHCNGKTDCPQGSDELNCPCEKYKMKECLIKTKVNLCVPESWICNLYITCLQYNNDSCQVPGHSRANCGPGQFLCHINQMCISQHRVCDGTPDCKGKEDEVFCSGGFCFVFFVLHISQLFFFRKIHQFHIWHFPFSAGIYRSHFRPNRVFVSAISDNTSSADEHDCLFQPNQAECSDLNFVLNTIVSKELFWIDTVLLDELTHTEDGGSVSLVFPKQWSIFSRGMKIICLNSCVFNTNWTVFAEVFQTTFVIQLENILFQNATIAVGNVHMIFKNIQFVNSVTTDWIQSDGEFDQIQVHFVQATFVSKSLTTSQFGVAMGKVFSASIFVISSI